MFLFKSKIVTVLFVVFNFVQLFSQNEVAKKSMFRKILGDELKSSITFMPLGYHTDRERHSEVFHDVWYVGVNYKGFELTVFKNSFDDPTVGAFYNREINFTKVFSLIYGGGIIYGYHGRLQNVDGIPLSSTFLIKGAINPVLGIALNYKVAKRWSIKMSFAPKIIIYGVRYTFKDAY